MTFSHGGISILASQNPITTTNATEEQLLSHISESNALLSSTMLGVSQSNAKLEEYIIGRLQRTAFNELLVAELQPKAGWSFAYGVNGRHVTSSQTGGAPTVIASASRAVVRVSGPNQTNILETRKTLRYVPGIGGLCRMTCIFATPHTNLFQLAGIGDSSDGLFLMYSGSNFGFAKRSNTSLDFISQSNWNIDKFNGDGRTRATFNPSFGHPISFRYQWLGYGALLLELENPETGLIEPAHIIKYAGTSQFVSFTNPNLPCHVEITTGASYPSGVTSSMMTPSAMAFQEGKPNGVLTADWMADTSTTANNIGTTEKPILSLRNETSFGGVTNKIRIEVKSLSVCATINSASPRSATIKCYRDTTANMAAALTGESFVAVRSGESCVSYDVTATAFTPPATAYLVNEMRLVVPYGGSPVVDLEGPIIVTPNETLVFTGLRVGGNGTTDIELTARWIEPL